MSKKWHEDRAFLNLRKEWYDKLKGEGFEDIENICWVTGESYECLDGVKQSQIVEMYSPERAAYYQLANQYLWELRKEAARDRRRKSPKRTNWGRRLKVWRLHAEGYSVREIAAKIDLYRGGVQSIIEDHRADMIEAYNSSDEVLLKDGEDSHNT